MGRFLHTFLGMRPGDRVIVPMLYNLPQDATGTVTEFRRDYFDNRKTWAKVTLDTRPITKLTHVDATHLTKISI